MHISSRQGYLDEVLGDYTRKVEGDVVRREEIKLIENVFML